MYVDRNASGILLKGVEREGQPVPLTIRNSSPYIINSRILEKPGLSLFFQKPLLFFLFLLFSLFKVEVNESRSCFFLYGGVDTPYYKSRVNG